MFRTVRGMRDLLPKDLAKRRVVEGVVRELFNCYGYWEVETPIIEFYDLLAAKAGEDIRERMYSFKDLKGRRLALRPEGTAPIARLVASKLKAAVKPLRIGYVGSFFRYDEPQLGRYREFQQAGFELLGSGRPEADVEILLIAKDFMERLGFLDYIVKIGHVGVLKNVLSFEGVEEDVQNKVMSLIDKGRRDEALKVLGGLSKSSRLTEVVSKLFGLKGDDVEEVIGQGLKALEGYGDAIKAIMNLRDILKVFKGSSMDSKLLLDLGFARGLEYYTGMIFEVYVPRLKIALNGGGRYDKLIELFGGQPTPAVGCAIGIDRVVLVMEKGNMFPTQKAGRKVFVIAVDDEVRAKALEISTNLRKGGVVVEDDVMGRGVGKGLSYAVKKNFTHAIIVGPRELSEESVVLRDLVKAEQRIVKIKELNLYLRG